MALGGVFSNPEEGRRVIMHEFHALGPLRLFPRLNDSDTRMAPRGRRALAPAPRRAGPRGDSHAAHAQMRELAREFTAHTVDDLGARWQLRLLSRPLYRYEMAEGDLIEGAIFAFVSDAGTDPEIVLVLEAVKDGEKDTGTTGPSASRSPACTCNTRGRKSGRRCGMIRRDHSATRTIRTG